MLNFWLYLLLPAALLDWLAVFKHWYGLRFFSKVLVLALLIGWYTSLGGWEKAGSYFGLALIFSLLGDFFLLERVVRFNPVFFQAGLAAFLLAQIFYIIGFNRGGPVLNAGSAAFLILVSAISFINGGRVISALRHNPRDSQMILPVVVYMLALSLMLISALSTRARPDWDILAAAVAGLGGVLFYISDSVLANNRFAAPIRGADLIVIITYHLGQFLLIAGVLLNFG